MKPSWKGSLTFGLVDIPVELFSAAEQHPVRFHLLHKKCLHPVIYHRWCEHCHQQVEWHEIEKGIQLKNRSYFVMSPENLKKLKPHRTSAIAITEFVEAEAIDPILFHEHYYLLPSKNRENSFFLFATALARTHKVAIGQFVLRDKEYVGAIRSYGDILLLTTLNYAYEIRKIPGDQDILVPKSSAKELKLAEQLISTLSKKSFSIKSFKDTFVTQLVQKISKLKKGVLITEHKHREKNVKPSSLVKALEDSLHEAKHKKKMTAPQTKGVARKISRR